MTTRALIIGTGPAAAATALALAGREDVEVTVIDIGLQLDAGRQEVIQQLAATEPAAWGPSLLEQVATQPASSGERGVPEKRSYGSNYPFRNVGQLDGVTAAEDATTSLVSAAYGGFSTIWGAQLMPFSASAFEAWPVSASAMRPHYEAILDEIPYSADVDDLAKDFPLMHEADSLPQLSERARRVLDAYKRQRSTLNASGITMGKARLAFRGRDCIRCGLCMTGCPYRLIYSAAQTFDELRRLQRLEYHSGLLALAISEQNDHVSVVVQELGTGQIHRFDADRVFVACGAIGTTRLVANSLRLFDVDLPMLESQQFVLPVMSLRACADPRYRSDFTLNQFNMLVAPGGDSVDVAQLHFYPFNPAFVDALPAFLRRARMERAQAGVLRRLSVALGYLPSWRSPRLLARIRGSSSDRPLPDVHISREPAPPGRNQMLRSVLARVSRAAPLLDLYPVLPMMRLAAGGKSYHWGGTFPHSLEGATDRTSDRFGRVGPWKRVHLVDASVFPTIPATTFTLTIMANAHRIASEAIELAP